MNPNAMNVAIAAIVMGSMVAIITPFAKVWMRKIELKGSAGLSSPDIEARLARIEQSIDAVAVEIERISEGQRFTTKLLSEPRPASGAGPR